VNKYIRKILLKWLGAAEPKSRTSPCACDSEGGCGPSAPTPPAGNTGQSGGREGGPKAAEAPYIWGKPPATQRVVITPAAQRELDRVVEKRDRKARKIADALSEVDPSLPALLGIQNKPTKKPGAK
jgi:hypothetical protein